ncbi:MAG: alpha/beta hydrolase [Actinoallomurus sp.]
MRSQALEIDGRVGRLAASIDVPEAVTGYALLAHCFSCGKDQATAADLGRALVRLGWAVVRVDFAGLGGSDGDFGENTTFSGGVDDIVRVADHMRSEFEAPVLLVGHSLGGAAALAAASRIPEVGAVVAVGAPFSPDHLIVDPVAADGLPRTGRPARVLIGDQYVTRGVRLLDDLTNLGHGVRLGDLDSAVLIMQDPDDEVVPFDHAVRIREAVGPRAALVPIEGGHFLRRSADRRRVADLVSVWATPFVKGGPKIRAPATARRNPPGERSSSGSRVPVGWPRRSERRGSSGAPMSPPPPARPELGPSPTSCC